MRDWVAVAGALAVGFLVGRWQSKRPAERVTPNRAEARSTEDRIAQRALEDPFFKSLQPERQKAVERTVRILAASKRVDGRLLELEGLRAGEKVYWVEGFPVRRAELDFLRRHELAPAPTWPGYQTHRSADMFILVPDKSADGSIEDEIVEHPGGYGPFGR